MKIFAYFIYGKKNPRGREDWRYISQQPESNHFGRILEHIRIEYVEPFTSWRRSLDEIHDSVMCWIVVPFGEHRTSSTENELESGCTWLYLKFDKVEKDELLRRSIFRVDGALFEPGNLVSDIQVLGEHFEQIWSDNASSNVLNLTNPFPEGFEIGTVSHSQSEGTRIQELRSRLETLDHIAQGRGVCLGIPSIGSNERNRVESLLRKVGCSSYTSLELAALTGFAAKEGLIDEDPAATLKASEITKAPEFQERPLSKDDSMPPLPVSLRPTPETEDNPSPTAARGNIPGPQNESESWLKLIPQNKKVKLLGLTAILFVWGWFMVSLRIETKKLRKEVDGVRSTLNDKLDKKDLQESLTNFAEGSLSKQLEMTIGEKVKEELNKRPSESRSRAPTKDLAERITALEASVSRKADEDDLKKKADKEEITTLEQRVKKLERR